MRTSIDGSIEIDVPATTAYAFWTRIEDFPRFIEPVETVDRIDEKRSCWKVNFGFRKQEWVAEITEVIPDKRRAWRTLHGPTSAGMVNFHSITEDRSLMTLHLDYDPRGVLENLGDELGIVSRVIQRALEQFKDHVEIHR
ncbi:MAG: SRPBCC family protein [Myxococcota bacterium]